MQLVNRTAFRRHPPDLHAGQIQQQHHFLDRGGHETFRIPEAPRIDAGAELVTDVHTSEVDFVVQVAEGDLAGCRRLNRGAVGDPGNGDELTGSLLGDDLQSWSAVAGAAICEHGSAGSHSVYSYDGGLVRKMDKVILTFCI